jgi:hypothetical protein
VLGGLSTINRLKAAWFYTTGFTCPAASPLSRFLRCGQPNHPEPHIYTTPAVPEAISVLGGLSTINRLKAAWFYTTGLTCPAASPLSRFLRGGQPDHHIHTASSISTPQALYPHRKLYIHTASSISAPHRKLDIRTAPQARYPHRTAYRISAPQA